MLRFVLKGLAASYAVAAYLVWTSHPNAETLWVMAEVSLIALCVVSIFGGLLSLTNNR